MSVLGMHLLIDVNGVDHLLRNKSNFRGIFQEYPNATIPCCYQCLTALLRVASFFLGDPCAAIFDSTQFENVTKMKAESG